MKKIIFNIEDLLYSTGDDTLSAVGVLLPRGESIMTAERVVLLKGENIMTAERMFYPPIR